MTKTKKISDVVTIDRRNAKRRAEGSAKHTTEAEPRIVERREKVSRRRQIDPTTCERDYSDAEVEFMHALDLYKRASGRMFPTCSEVLEVLIGLGYQKASPAAPAVAATAPALFAATTESQSV